MGKPLHGEARSIVIKVIKFFEDEKSSKKYVIPVDQAVKRACAATGLSKRTLLRIKNEARSMEEAAAAASCSADGEMKTEFTPVKKRKNNTKKIELDSFNIAAMRNLINGFYLRKEMPTLKKVLAAAKEQLNFPGERTTLRRILVQHLGYKFKKLKNVKELMIVDESQNNMMQNNTGMEEIKYVNHDMNMILNRQ